MKYLVTLNGITYEVEVEKGQAMVLDEYEALSPSPSIQAAPTPEPSKQVVRAPVPSAAKPAEAVVENGTAVKAPLPGNILSIPVMIGQSVKAGDLLMTIEAMKMENEVLAPCDGCVKQILTAKGSLVATGDVLIVI